MKNTTITPDEYKALLGEHKPIARDIRSHKTRKIVCMLIFGVCLAVFCFSAAMLYIEILEYKAGSNAYAALQSASVIQRSGFETDGSEYSLYETASNNPLPEEQEINPSALAPEAWPRIDFTALNAVNPDIEAWIVSDDGTINYPIVHGGDNTYYLEHLFDGTKNKAGCLFIDSENVPDFSDYNTIIYGHNMKDGSMFGKLENYREQAYFDANPRIKLITPNGNYILELFAGLVADGYGDSWKIKFSDGYEFTSWAEKAKSKSVFNSNVAVTENHRVVTLSTCAYDFEDAYFAVMGILIPYE